VKPTPRLGSSEVTGTFPCLVTSTCLPSDNFESLSDNTLLGETLSIPAVTVVSSKLPATLQSSPALMNDISEKLTRSHVCVIDLRFFFSKSIEIPFLFYRSAGDLPFITWSGATLPR
jgi:hypothetical protein